VDAEVTTQETSTGTLTWAPGARVGRYELMSPIARGGMAEVWLAKQSGPEGFEKVVALKRILAAAGNASDFVTMFLDEARIAAQLSHPNIAQIFELADDSGTYYLAMEYLEGETLSHVLRRSRELSRPLPIGLAVRVVSDAAAGLGHAHQKRSRSGKPLDIVHRDVSPQNIMVTYEGVVKVVDFGIARAAGRAARTQMGSVKGKVTYMSPEQARGETVDARCDVFALGVVLFEALTGTRLHEGDDDVRVLRRLALQEALPTVRSRRPEVAPELDALVSRAMAATTQERFPSGIEMQAALEQYLRTAPPPSSSFELRQFVQELFADRLQRSRAMVMTTASRITDPELPVPQISSARANQATVAARAPRTGAEPAGSHTAAKTDPARPRSRGPLILGGAIVLGLALGIGWAVRQPKQGSEPAREASPAPPPRPPVVVAPPAPPAPVHVEPAPPAPAPQPPPVVESVTPPKPAVAVKAKGKLRLETDPYTQVYVHGRRLGDTPLIDVELPSGMQALHLVNADEHIDEHIEVEIKPGQLTLKKLKLQ
jgi:serine/threonine-protein kinase